MGRGQYLPILTLFAGLACAGACGRELAPADDERSTLDGGSGGDAGADADDGRCKTSDPFLDPEELTGWAPGKSFLSARRGVDGLWYVSFDETPGPDEDTTGRLAVMREDNGALVAATPNVLAAVIGGADGGATPNDEQPVLSPDGKRLFFQSDRGQDARSFRLFVANRAELAEPFGAPRVVATTGLSQDPNASAEEPYPVADGRIFFSFQETKSGDVQESIWAGRVEGFESAPAIAAASMVGNVDSPFEDKHVVAAEDASEIFFSSERAEDGGSGDEDIWHATWNGASFDAPQRLAGLATAQNEKPTYLTPDRCALYFVRVTPTANELHRIYVARRRR